MKRIKICNWCVFWVVFFSTYLLMADRTEYETSKTCHDSNGEFFVINYFDDSVSYLLLIKLSSGQEVFKIQSDKFTDVVVSWDSKYIACMSYKKNAKSQISVYNLSGMLLYKRSISSQEAHLTKSEFDYFVKRYPVYHKSLIENGLIYYQKKPNNEGGMYYIDMLSQKSFEGFEYLYKRIGNNHLSKNFTSTTTNFIFWYSLNTQKFPSMKIGPHALEFYENDKEVLTNISVNDPQQERIQIPITIKNSDGVQVPLDYLKNE